MDRSTGVRARLRSRRTATLGLAAVLLLIALFATAAAIIGRAKSIDIVAAYDVASAFGDVRTAIGDENLLADRYRSTPAAATRAAFSAAAERVEARLRNAADLDRNDAADQASIEQVRGLHARYRAGVLELFAAVDASDRERTEAVEAGVVEPTFDDLRQLTIRLEVSHDAELAPRLDALARISTLFAIGTPLAVFGAMAVIWVLWRQTRRAEAVERLAAARLATDRTRSAMLAGMSHELRTPLNAILGFSELVLEGTDLSDRQRTYLQNVRTAGKRLLRIVNDVLAIANDSAATQLHPEVTPLSSLLEPVITAWSERAQAEGLAFSVEAPTDAHLVVDVAAVRLVLTNLLSNAVKFTQAPGRVTLTATIGEAALVMEIADTGVGIAPERLARVFEPFGRVTPEPAGARGAGLGLARVKQLVERQGGTIALESTVGAGTTVRVRLPSVVIVAKAGARVLVVDDEQADAGLVSALAWEHGLFVEVATSVARALSAIGRELPVGVVLDLRLPDGRGEQVLAALRAQPTRIPVVIVTVEDPGAVLLDVDDFITKPMDAKRLRAWLARIAGTSKEIHANTAG